MDKTATMEAETKFVETSQHRQKRSPEHLEARSPQHLKARSPQQLEARSCQHLEARPPQHKTTLSQHETTAVDNSKSALQQPGRYAGVGQSHADTGHSHALVGQPYTVMGQSHAVVGQQYASTSHPDASFGISYPVEAQRCSDDMSLASYEEAFVVSENPILITPEESSPPDTKWALIGALVVTIVFCCPLLGISAFAFAMSATSRDANGRTMLHTSYALSIAGAVMGPMFCGAAILYFTIGSENE